MLAFPERHLLYARLWLRVAIAEQSLRLDDSQTFSWRPRICGHLNSGVARIILCLHVTPQPLSLRMR